MITVTLKDAKARLNALVEAAERGEQVVLMRGAQVVARIEALSEGDMELAPRLTDNQAARFWDELAEKPLKRKSFASPQRAVRYLKERA